MLHLNNLSVIGNSKYGDGRSLVGNTIRLAGFEINSYLNKNWFYFAKFDGAYDGIRAGYMDILLGAGYQFSFNNNKTNILTKFGMGAGGGGGVDSQGGVLLYPDISVEQHIVNNTYLSINKGFMMSPNSFFKSATFGVGLKYYSNINGITTTAKDARAVFKGIEVIVKQDAYFNAKRMTKPKENLHQISLQLNYHLTKNIYLAGQTSFANFGNAGAYAEGIVGVGLQSNYFMNDKINIQEILNRFPSRDDKDEYILKSDVKQAIKEIVEAVVDKCAEEATTKTVKTRDTTTKEFPHFVRKLKMTKYTI